MIYMVFRPTSLPLIRLGLKVFQRHNFHGQYLHKGPVTRCDAVHPRWDVPTLLRYIKITCDMLRCIFQHVGIFAPDFRISQLFIIRFSNGLQYCDRGSIPFHVICDRKLSVRYFLLPTQRWSSQENIKPCHRE